MGKAGKWIRNFLLGKKEEKLKQIDTFCPENKASSSNKMVVKRRWSLRKLTSGRITSKVVEHNFSRSYDLDDSIKLQIQALLEAHIPRYLPTALAKVYENTTEFENTAATRIQAAFRAYLARKALHALRGLVKLQALVRGHLVRKQTTTTLRGMHALMSIQVRARINRIQTVEEANLLSKQTQEIPYFKGLMTEENRESRNRKVEEMVRVKSRSGALDDVKNRNFGSMAFYSKRLSVSKRENPLKEDNNNNNIGTTTTAPNSPVAKGNYYYYYRDMAMATSLRGDIAVPVPHRQSWSPNYMNKTKSSKAKARSRSEPRQRPKLVGTNGTTNPNQDMLSSSNSSRFDHWVSNLGGSVKDSKRDSIGSSTVTSDSYY